jgi:hypothetical protein
MGPLIDSQVEGAEELAGSYGRVDDAARLAGIRHTYPSSIASRFPGSYAQFCDHMAYVKLVENSLSGWKSSHLGDRSQARNTAQQLSGGATTTGSSPFLDRNWLRTLRRTMPTRNGLAKYRLLLT